jgi:Fe-S-cluster containining protein
MNIDFECTQCGKCCHNLKVPLTVSEAIDWLTDGNNVQVICEAVPWAIEPAADDLPAAYKRRRSFATTSGTLPVRVTVILAAHFAGPCPNLKSDMRCAIYERRPLTCRIYPVEVNPFVELRPTAKECPPEAWTADRPALVRRGVLVDAHTQEVIQRSRDAAVQDIHVKQMMCAFLGLEVAALANEGMVVHSPDQALLLSQLQRSTSEPGTCASYGWRVLSNRHSTVQALASAGAVSAWVGEADELPYQYHGFHPQGT